MYFVGILSEPCYYYLGYVSFILFDILYIISSSLCCSIFSWCNIWQIPYYIYWKYINLYLFCIYKKQPFLLLFSRFFWILRAFTWKSIQQHIVYFCIFLHYFSIRDSFSLCFSGWSSLFSHLITLFSRNISLSLSLFVDFFVVLLIFIWWYIFYSILFIFMYLSFLLSFLTSVLSFL